MTSDLTADEAVLRGRREPYVRATVVWARRPVSARAGDKALVTADGRLQGWVGGSCAEPIVVREARRALAEGTPRLLRLGPPGELPAEGEEGQVEGVVIAPVTCASEGSLQIFLEPEVPPTHLVVVGRSPLAHALVAMAGVLGFDTAVIEREDADTWEPGAGPNATVLTELDMAKADVGPESYVVVATMGRYDEEAVAAALATHARYVALVASESRASSVVAALRAAGVSEGTLGRLRSPAGLPLGDLPHEETAVAILAEIVQRKNQARTVDVAPVHDGGGGHAESAVVSAVDPVCGMTVEVGPKTPSAERDGMTSYFCCPGCRWRFLHPES